MTSRGGARDMRHPERCGRVASRHLVCPSLRRHDPDQVL